jgi:hypothetical protein
MATSTTTPHRLLACLALAGVLALPVRTRAGTLDLPDRGPGVATSTTGLTLGPGELLVFASFERSENSGFEYSPNDFDVASGEDFQGNLRTSEEVVFLGYGLGDAFALGLEVAAARATFHRDEEDATGTPASVRESGLGDVQAELTWRFQRETERRPELYLFAEVALPHDRSKPLTGTPDWLAHVGVGLAREFSTGSLLSRISAEYDLASESPLDFGEWSLEWLHRFSSSWRLSAGFEGNIGGANNLDEVWTVADLEWRLAGRLALRFHSGYGLTSKTKGWSPEVGLVVRRPRS